MNTNAIYAIAGKPYGHVAGHNYYDAEVECSPCGSSWIATLTITWGSARGSHDEEHGRLEYGARGGDAAEAIERAAAEALDAADDDDAVHGCIATAKSRALRKACELCDDGVAA